MKNELALAVAQFTGWHHAKMNGDRIVELVESMGLSHEEWKRIKNDVVWLNESDKLDIETHFKATRKNKD
jgi:hypothetical protein